MRAQSHSSTLHSSNKERLGDEAASVASQQPPSTTTTTTTTTELQASPAATAAAAAAEHDDDKDDDNGTGWSSCSSSMSTASTGDNDDNDNDTVSLPSPRRLEEENNNTSNVDEEKEKKIWIVPSPDSLENENKSNGGGFTSNSCNSDSLDDDSYLAQFSESSVSVDKEGGDPYVKAPLLAMGTFQEPPPAMPKPFDKQKQPKTTESEEEEEEEETRDRNRNDDHHNASSLLIPRIDHIPIQHVDQVAEQLSALLVPVVQQHDEHQQWDAPTNHTTLNETNLQAAKTKQQQSSSSSRLFRWPSSSKQQGYDGLANDDNEEESSKSKPASYHTASQDELRLASSEDASVHHTSTNQQQQQQQHEESSSRKLKAPAAKNIKSQRRKKSSSKTTKNANNDKTSRSAERKMAKKKKDKKKHKKKQKESSDDTDDNNAMMVESILPAALDSSSSNQQRDIQVPPLLLAPPVASFAAASTEVAFSERFAIKIRGNNHNNSYTSLDDHVHETTTTVEQQQQQLGGIDTIWNSGDGGDIINSRAAFDLPSPPMEEEEIVFFSFDEEDQLSPIPPKEQNDSSSVDDDDKAYLLLEKGSVDENAIDQQKQSATASGDAIISSSGNQEANNNSNMNEEGEKESESSSKKDLNDGTTDEVLSQSIGNIIVVSPEDEEENDGTWIDSVALNEKEAVVDSVVTHGDDDEKNDDYDEELGADPTCNTQSSKNMGDETTFSQSSSAAADAGAHDDVDGEKERRGAGIVHVKHQPETMFKRLQSRLSTLRESLSSSCPLVNRFMPWFPWLMCTGFIICLMFGTAYFGANLALRNSGIQTTLEELNNHSSSAAPLPTSPSSDGLNPNSVEPTPFIPPPAVVQVTCPEGNVPLELAITFDNKPSEIGIFLRDYATRSLIWNFAPGSFRSMALLLRENYFIVCLSPRLVYELEITDTGGNGLNSTFVQQAVYGSFRVLYQHQLVTNYSGYCSMEGFSQCGNFCSCSYRLMENITKVTGQCTTSCNTASTRGGTSP